MPSLYKYYDPNQARAEAQAKRDGMYERLRSMGAARQRFTDEQYARSEAERMAGEKQAGIDQASLDRSAFDETSKGAMTGAMFGGPWGALIGGGLGSVLGQVKGFGQRRKEGQGFWGALGRSVLDIGGLGSAVKSATKGEFAPIQSGIQALPMLGGMVANKAFGGGGPEAAADWAQQGNDQAAFEREMKWGDDFNSGKMAGTFAPKNAAGSSFSMTPDTLTDYFKKKNTA